MTLDEFLDGWQAQALDAVRRPTPSRRQWVEDCPYCAHYTPAEMFPPHDASPRCESGRRDHCTCDICF